jgi:hypothetical protein
MSNFSKYVIALNRAAKQTKTINHVEKDIILNTKYEQTYQTVVFN